MSDVPVSQEGPKRTLSTTGVTINAMALIAPGAFLWITFQLQAAQTGVGANASSTAYDMWTGIVFALIVAFLTAISYSEMAKIYPDAGYGSAYYFAEKTFLDKEDAKHHKWARISKLITGWAAHLFYWVYPGIMVTFMAVLISYIAGLFGATDHTGPNGTGGDPGLPLMVKILVAIGFAILCGAIASRGINGSTMTSLIVNVIQLITLVFFSILAIWYRVSNPQNAVFTSPIGHTSAASILLPHSMTGVLFQSTIAILILVGFESCTALGAEAKDPKRSVPTGVLLSLVIQGLFAYLIEYFAANYAISDKLIYTDSAGKVSTGMAAAGLSQAPIGDMMRLFGDHLLHGLGFGLAVTMAVTVALAILGTTLACINTGVRVSYAMAKDKEMPEIMGLMHGKFATPVAGTWVLTILSAIIGAIGVYSTVVQTGIGIASNLGTFVLYALICIWTIIAFSHRPDKSVFKHVLIPIAGLITNAIMVSTIFYLAFGAGGDSAKEGRIAIYFAIGWAVVSLIYVLIANARSGRKLMEHPIANTSS